MLRMRPHSMHQDKLLRTIPLVESSVHRVNADGIQVMFT